MKIYYILGIVLLLCISSASAEPIYNISVTSIEFKNCDDNSDFSLLNDPAFLLDNQTLTYNIIHPFDCVSYIVFETVNINTSYTNNLCEYYLNNNLLIAFETAFSGNSQAFATSLTNDINNPNDVYRIMTSSNNLRIHCYSLDDNFNHSENYYIQINDNLGNEISGNILNSASYTSWKMILMLGIATILMLVGFYIYVLIRGKE